MPSVVGAPTIENEIRGESFVVETTCSPSRMRTTESVASYSAWESTPLYPS